MIAVLAADGIAPDVLETRLEAALHGLADLAVFLLDLLSGA
ncbi:MAG: hypothetical protein RL885_04275 [Planctomycetota bacterium]